MRPRLPSWCASLPSLPLLLLLVRRRRTLHLPQPTPLFPPFPYSPSFSAVSPVTPCRPPYPLIPFFPSPSSRDALGSAGSSCPPLLLTVRRAALTAPPPHPFRSVVVVEQLLSPCDVTSGYNVPRRVVPDRSLLHSDVAGVAGVPAAVDVAADAQRVDERQSAVCVCCRCAHEVGQVLRTPHPWLASDAGVVPQLTVHCEEDAVLLDGSDRSDAQPMDGAAEHFHEVLALGLVIDCVEVSDELLAALGQAALP